MTDFDAMTDEQLNLLSFEKAGGRIFKQRGEKLWTIEMPGGFQHRDFAVKPTKSAILARWEPCVDPKQWAPMLEKIPEDRWPPPADRPFGRAVVLAWLRWKESS